jgi:hypothetical protein
MQFGVPGPLAVPAADGDSITIPGLKVRVVLAALLVHDGRPVPADRLADLWGAGGTGRHHAGGSVRLAQDVRGDRRCLAVVGARYQDRLSPPDVWLHPRRNRPPRHRPTNRTGLARTRRRAARCRRRTVLRGTGNGTGPGGPPRGAGGRRRTDRGAARRDRRAGTVLQSRGRLEGGATGGASERRPPQPHRRPQRRHPRGWPTMGPC